MDKIKSEPITLQTVKNNAEIRTYIDAANKNMEVLGYTEHGARHGARTAAAASSILRELGYDERMCEIAAIAGWTHDIGNAINRLQHGITGATLVYTILNRMDMPAEELSLIIGAIGNHEEEVGTPVSPVSAALIIADKSDSHRSRVRKPAIDMADIHDRINMSIAKNYLTVDPVKRLIRLVLIMDKTGSPMDYLQIYLSRMILCEKAANYLKCHFELVINGVVINQRQDSITPHKLSKGEKQISMDINQSVKE